MKRANLVGASLGLLADHLIGEPPARAHPVSIFGTSMTRLERVLHGDDRLAGVVYAALGVASGAACGLLVRSVGASTWLSVAGRELCSVARDIEASLAAGDLEGARGKLPALVGRDPRSLDEKEIARAVIESVAENTVDAVVAPALWAAVAGAPGTLAYRAVNTLDAMVGHRSERYERFGWASAKLDDVAAWVPARITALLVAVLRPASARAVYAAVRSQAPAHPSPNSGVAEAAFAAALGLRLGGRNDYAGRVELRPTLGTGRAPEPPDIDAAARLSEDVAFALATTLLAFATTRVNPPNLRSRLELRGGET